MKRRNASGDGSASRQVRGFSMVDVALQIMSSSEDGYVADSDDPDFSSNIPSGSQTGSAASSSRSISRSAVSRNGYSSETSTRRIRAATRLLKGIVDSSANGAAVWEVRADATSPSSEADAKVTVGDSDNDVTTGCCPWLRHR